jgi:zeaxanthin glucosyltransferase
MATFALICPPFHSHLRLFDALAEELERRGHRSTFLLNGGAQELARLSHADVRTVSPVPGASVGEVVKRAARPSGPLGILRTVADMSALTDTLCRDGPQILRDIQADAVLADQMEPAASLLAEHLGLPFLSIASALPIDREPGIPLPFLPWPYDASERGLHRNRAGERVAGVLMMTQRRTVARWAQRFGLPARKELHDCLSPLGTISQTISAFDFPRATSRTRVRAVGPIRNGPETGGEFTLDIDEKRPFVYASLGTLQGHRATIFRKIAKACRDLGAQLLVTHCGQLSGKPAAALGATWVTDFAPQRAVLARADACVTHAGLNTVMDALEFGVPLLAIPIAFDQPGVAARIVHHEVGLRLPRRWLTARQVRRALETLLYDRRFRRNAGAMGAHIRAAGGARTAVDVIESVLFRSSA